MTDLQKIQDKNRSTFNERWTRIYSKTKDEQQKLDMLTIYESYHLLFNQLKTKQND